jgi:hypothetical protein
MRPPDPNDKAGMRRRLILQWYAAHDHPIPNTIRSWAGPRIPIPPASARKNFYSGSSSHPDWYKQPRRKRYS